MAVKRIPFGYRPGKTILHRIPAGVKLLCLIALSIAVYLFLPALAAAILLIIIASIAARIPPWKLLSGSGPLLVLALFVLSVGSINLNPFTVSLDGLFNAAVTVMRMYTVFAAAGLFFAVTTMGELRLSLAAFETTLKKIFSGGKTGNIAFFSLGLSLMLGFIPRFFELWETANLACEARSCKRGLRRLCILILLVTGKMMEAAADTALALEARALGINK